MGQHVPNLCGPTYHTQAAGVVLGIRAPAVHHQDVTGEPWHVLGPELDVGVYEGLYMAAVIGPAAWEQVVQSSPWYGPTWRRLSAADREALRRHVLVTPPRRALP